MKRSRSSMTWPRSNASWTERNWLVVPVLATCHIQPLNQAFENTFPRLSLLADSPEGE